MVDRSDEHAQAGVADATVAVARATAEPRYGRAPSLLALDWFGRAHLAGGRAPALRSLAQPVGVDQFAVVTAAGQVYTASTAIHLAPAQAPLSFYKRVPTVHSASCVRRLPAAVVRRVC